MLPTPDQLLPALKSLDTLLPLLFPVLLVLSYLSIRGLALSRHRKTARVTAAFGLTVAPAPKGLYRQFMFQPRLKGVLEGRPFEISESQSFRPQEQMLRRHSTLHLEVAPTLSRLLSAKQKHLGRGLMRAMGASPELQPLKIPGLDAKLDVVSYTPEDRDRLRDPGVQVRLLRLLSLGHTLEFAKGRLTLTSHGGINEARWQQLLSAAREFLRALNTVEGRETKNLAS